MGIGKTIHKLCEIRGLSIRKLSIMANVPYSTLYSLIKRDSTGADSDTINRIAKILDVSVADILSDPNEMIELLSEAMDDENREDENREKNTPLTEMLQSQTNRLNAFITSVHAIGYKITFEKIDGKSCYTFYGKNSRHGYHIEEQDIVSMLNESLEYTEYLCFSMEKKLEVEQKVKTQQHTQSSPTADATPPEGKDPTQE